MRERLKGRICWGNGGAHIIMLWSMSRDEVWGKGGLGGEKREQLGVKNGKDKGEMGGCKLGLALLWKPRGLWMGRMGRMGRMGKESGGGNLTFRACGMRGLNSYKGEE